MLDKDASLYILKINYCGCRINEIDNILSKTDAKLIFYELDTKNKRTRKYELRKQSEAEHIRFLLSGIGIYSMYGREDYMTEK